MKFRTILCFIILLFGVGILSSRAQYDNSVTIGSRIDTGSDIVLVDSGNVAGLDPGATDGYDSGIDIPEPAPPVSDYLSTYFPHPAWSSIFGDNFMVDIRNGNDDLTDAVKVYTFEVSTDQVGETVELNFTVGGSYPETYGIVLYDSQSGEYRNLRENADYAFVAGSSARSLDLRLGDATGPDVTFTFPGAGTTLTGNSNYTVTWNFTDVSPIRYTKLFYSLDAGATWTFLDSLGGGPESYLWTTPDTISTQCALKIDAEDWAGNFSSTSTGYAFTIARGYMENSFAAGWHMTSIPLIPANTSIDSIYGDDVIGAYFVYDYSPSGGYGLVQNVENGYGYWLALETGADIDVTGATAVDPVTIPLDMNWNIVGAAMASPVVRDSLHFSDGITTYNFTDAVNAGWISPAFYEYVNATGSYNFATMLNPWGGYWLQTLQAGLQMITNPPYDGEVFEGENPEAFADERNWAVPIGLTQGSLSEGFSSFGVREDASEGYDTWYDLPTPPDPPNGVYLRIVFHHPEWAAPAGDTFCTDFRPPIEPQASLTWVSLLEASQPGQIVVDFSGIGEILPAGYSAEIVYCNTAVNLLENPVIVLDYSEPVEMIITVTNPATGIREASGEVWGTFKVNGAYPNPFNPLTAIRFCLPQAAKVRLDVFDVNGRLVSSGSGAPNRAQATPTEKHFDPGTHEITFDGSGLPSGIYLYRLTAGSFTAAGKMVLMK